MPATVVLVQWSMVRNMSRAARPLAIGIVGSLSPCDPQYGIRFVPAQVPMISPDIGAIARKTLPSAQPSAMVWIAPMLNPVAKIRL